MIISAIRSAIQHCHSHDTLTSTTIETKETTEVKQEKADVHESDVVDTAGLESQLKDAVIAAFGSARAAFDAHSKHGSIGKKELKRLIKRVLPSLEQGEAKRLKKGLPNRLSAVDFCSFIGGPENTGSCTDKGEAGKTKDADSSGLASLPPEVPEVCNWIAVLYIDGHILCVAAT